MKFRIVAIILCRRCMTKLSTEQQGVLERSPVWNSLTRLPEKYEALTISGSVQVAVERQLHQESPAGS